MCILFEYIIYKYIYIYISVPHKPLPIFTPQSASKLPDSIANCLPEREGNAQRSVPLGQGCQELAVYARLNAGLYPPTINAVYKPH